MESKRRNPTTRNGQVSCTELVDFPTEVLFDILGRLPLETILASRAVCTTLCAVTRHPYFIRKVGASPNQNRRVILKQHSEGARAISHLVLLDIEERKTRRIPLKRTLANLKIRSSCNGLLCMTQSQGLNPVAIYNPLTGEHVVLPPSSFESPRFYHNQLIGLGFDTSSNKYKAVRAYSIAGGDPFPTTAFEIISLGDRSWRKLNAPQNLLSCVVHSFTFWNGALYCAMSSGHYPIVVQISLSAEAFRCIPFDGKLSTLGDFLGLIEVGGSLLLIQHHGSIIKVWRLTVDEDGGGMLFVTHVPADVANVNWDRNCNKFLCQLDKDSYLTQVGYIGSDHQRCDNLRQYCTKEKTNTDLHIPGLPSNFEAFCFEPSLLPLQAAFADRMAREG